MHLLLLYPKHVIKLSGHNLGCYMMKVEKIINRMWVRSRAGTFSNGNR